MSITFPSDTDFKRIGDIFSFDNLNLDPSDFERKLPFPGSIDRTLITIELLPWLNSFNSRIFHTRRSYIFMTFYFEQDIPDEEYFVSPGKDGAAISYFPYLDNDTYIRKDYFDYFADTFYYKVFSAWDTIGHILSLLYHMHIKKPDFEKAVNKLSNINSILHTSLLGITNDDSYKSAKKIRNDMTHNRPPGVIGSGFVQATPTMSYLSITQYTPSKQVKENADQILTLLEKTVTYLKL